MTLSVICPIYNEEKYIGQFLDSLLKHTDELDVMDEFTGSDNYMDMDEIIKELGW